MNAIAMPRVRFSTGAVEALKYLALVSMVIDHVNKALFDSSLSWAIPLGRLAMPIFSMLVAYNLARPQADNMKALRRLLLFGLLATPFHETINGGGLLPLNVMFTFALAVALIEAIEAPQPTLFRIVAASCLFGLGGLFVDYLWAGPALVITAYLFFKRPTALGAVAIAITLAGMCVTVGNWWAFLAIAPIGAATFYTPSVPRLRWFFWAFYPAHLVVLWLLQQSGNY